ncbi:MAG TPA: YbhB/YbcL family Raf kinase inhibitor-like protein [Polyangia bacterium]
MVARAEEHGAAGTIKVSSSAFDDGGRIPTEFTCEGKGVPPPISWSAVPSKTASIAVLVEDPDGPDGTFEHFVAFNLPPDRKSLPSEAIRAIAPGSALATARNSSGTVGFAPICPPSGRHHYRFEVVALDAMLTLPPASDASAVRAAMQGHVLARGELVGIFGKR